MRGPKLWFSGLLFSMRLNNCRTMCVLPVNILTDRMIYKIHIQKKKTKWITSNIIETPSHARIRICATGWDDLPLRCVYTHLLIFLPPLFIFSKNWKNNPHQPRNFSLKNIDTSKKSTAFDRSRWDLFKKYLFLHSNFLNRCSMRKTFL